MGRGLCRGLGTNAQVTTPGELGFRRGPLGGGFSSGVGRGYQNDMVGSHWPRQVAVWVSRLPTAMCLKKDLGNIRIWGMGYGAGVVAWVGYKCPIHHPGWVGFRRGPLGGGFSPGVERGYQDDIAGSHWPRQVAV
ncbi:hypothetical protein HanRHA438_Chr10g0456381 [Helianthus annuus]|uniref:Uncharacterized protein n=1 Tax=Helianthus annuus TaxID=4232 RepID=A0A9K3NDX3_HELAN|nr:hypothetical protein HanXRQr2_Chr08g0353441 [Helianthus annuus]KAJ0522109.1 hypothetical protein HanIR_Chr10g0478781 [Helianthus annuus]KAJ0720181.1 hypothetical protein HanLR1_Chr08g0290371 [Helianthus annuus]KAJ0723410.1 hypothetical protein HanOQP8_Chr08g0297891 [Helianthus annuus]KAJ0879858.1 hypothetical protein HanRHA438_Chr10g0456381 [Helianthus annuus]